ncbi:MAG: hypothetical protein AB1696_22440 [Planctomycetota bacterium]
MPRRMPRKRQPQTLPTHSEDGVDLTLIRWMLSLTPAERIQAAQYYTRALMEKYNLGILELLELQEKTSPADHMDLFVADRRILDDYMKRHHIQLGPEN